MHCLIVSLNIFLLFISVNSRGPEESDTIIKDSGYDYSATYKWEKKAGKQNNYFETKVTIVQLNMLEFLKGKCFMPIGK